jgi:hypothetical protein
VLGVTVDAGGKIEVESLLAGLNHPQSLSVMALAWNRNRSGEGKIRGISGHNGSIEPAETLPLYPALVVELW